MSATVTSIRTADAPTPKGPYSQAVVVNGLLISAGFGPHDPASGEVVGVTIEEQTERVMKNVSAVLEEAGVTFGDVIKVTVHLLDLANDFVGFNSVYERFVQEPYPVRITVGSDLPGIRVELEVMAVAPN